jgi:hypothetical protein
MTKNLEKRLFGAYLGALAVTVGYISYRALANQEPVINYLAALGVIALGITGATTIVYSQRKKKSLESLENQAQIAR